VTQKKRPPQFIAAALLYEWVFLLVLIAGPVELVTAEVCSRKSDCCGSIDRIDGHYGQRRDRCVALADQG